MEVFLGLGMNLQGASCGRFYVTPNADSVNDWRNSNPLAIFTLICIDLNST
jgi:hypothetical protein